MKHFLRPLAGIGLLWAAGCGDNQGAGGSGGAAGAGGSGGASTIDAAPDAPVDFTLAGTVTYDRVPAKDDVTEGGVRLDYGAIVALPARRMVIQALDPGGAEVVAGITDDAGHFSLVIPAGKMVKLRVSARLKATAYVPDGIGKDFCNGAAWDVRVVDNTQRHAQYAMDSPNTYGEPQTDIMLHAALGFANGRYTDRSAAPFALADQLVDELELVCEAQPAQSFPVIYINWSVNNQPVDGNVAAGDIGTSYYDGTVNGVSNLYLLGKEDVDTDEYDDHVVAHEFSHYFEDRLYRADSIGGTHGDADTLDARVAFGEGYGDGMSGIVLEDPVYVDTNGLRQARGFSIRIDAAPVGDDRGYYSEDSVMYFLYKLWDARDATPNHGSYDRIDDVLRNHQRTTDAFTTVQTFAAYYDQLYGAAAEGMQDLWTTGLGTPYASLCAGTCGGTGNTADLYDSDDDIGVAYGTGGTSPRRYPQMTGPTFAAGFWQLYRPLAAGLNAATAHDQIRFGGSTDPSNKLGGNRWYRYVGTGTMTTIAVSRLTNDSCATAGDLLDMEVFQAGTLVTSDTSSSACPQVRFATTAGSVYIININGAIFSREVAGWDLTVTP